MSQTERYNALCLQGNMAVNSEMTIFSYYIATVGSAPDEAKKTHMYLNNINI